MQTGIIMEGPYIKYLQHLNDKNTEFSMYENDLLDKNQVLILEENKMVVRDIYRFVFNLKLSSKQTLDTCFEIALRKLHSVINKY